MVIRYARKTPAIRLAITGDWTAGGCDYLILTVDQATAVATWQQRAKVTDLIYVA